MAFVLRRPFAISTAFKQSSKSSAAPLRAFHNRPFKSSQTNSFTSKPSSPISALTKSRDAFRRTYMQQPYQAARPDTGSLGQRLLYGAGIFGGTLVAINLLFNRETREDGGMPPFERKYLNETFLHTGLGVGIIGIAARALHQNGWSVRLMAANPWAVMGLGLAASIGTMYGTFNTSPDNYVQKYALWTGFNVTQAAILSPLMFMSPALLARAGLYTVAMMGSIAFVGATAKQEKYLYLGGPLLAGVAIVAVSGLAPLVLPATAARTLMWTDNIWLYGGLAVFGGFTLYDVQKVLHHARMAERGLVQRDAVNESISLELDFLNIFIRMVQILGMRNNRK
ncbi:MAG: hypothetical protein M1836_006761 [Candelina mexicana]|nr:MAG: hypothetical protein M1836_006761 [Candelina mexicana]